jgi:hypothetical protein
MWPTVFYASPPTNPALHHTSISQNSNFLTEQLLELAQTCSAFFPTGAMSNISELSQNLDDIPRHGVFDQDPSLLPDDELQALQLRNSEPYDKQRQAWMAELAECCSVPGLQLSFQRS